MDKVYGSPFRVGDLVRCVDNGENRVLEEGRIYCIRERSFYSGRWFVKVEGEGLLSRVNFYADRFVKADPIMSLEDML